MIHFTANGDRIVLCMYMCVGITKKTQVIKGELNPVWNEVCRFTCVFVFVSYVGGNMHCSVHGVQ